MNRNYFLIIVFFALACLVLIFISLGREIATPITKEPYIQPPIAPFKTYVYGSGIVEPRSENIYIGTPLNRIVEQVAVTVGSHVKKGDLLFKLEDRDLQANLLAQQFAYEKAKAQLQRLESYPRAEDIASAKAAVASAKSRLDLAKNQYEMTLQLPDPRAISQEERNKRMQNYQQAEANLNQAQADFEKIQSGTWGPDLEIAKLEVKQAEANVNQIKTEIQRTKILAPIDGTVLQIKIREGEFPSLDSTRNPLMILGDTEDMYLRVSINQLDIPYFHQNARAVAFLQGDANVEFPLEFVRIEPLLTDKQNLTNELTEKVDTRVLNIIYKIVKENPNVFVGQQMDVFIEANYITQA